MFRKLLSVWGGAFALAFAPVVAEAARVSPMIVNVVPFGSGSVARVELSNPGNNTFPVEVQMFRGVIGERGELELTPADDMFLVFPAQVIVPANSQQVFRIQYIGDPELAASEVFYMQIRQIPVQLAPTESRLQLVVNFNILVNVVPEGTRPDPVVDAVQPITREEVAEGAETGTPPIVTPGLEVRVVNRGTRYFTAGTVPWEIDARAEDGTEVRMRLRPEEVARHTGYGVIAPGRARIFFIPTEKPVAAGTARVRLVQ